MEARKYFEIPPASPRTKVAVGVNKAALVASNDILSQQVSKPFS